MNTTNLEAKFSCILLRNPNLFDCDDMVTPIEDPHVFFTSFVILICTRTKNLFQQLAKQDNLKNIYMRKSNNGSSFSSEILAFNTKKPPKSQTLNRLSHYSTSDKGSL